MLYFWGLHLIDLHTLSLRHSRLQKKVFEGHCMCQSVVQDGQAST